MFAASAQSKVYHLIERNSTRTICGLKVSRFTSAEPTGDRLHRIATKPAGYSECKHCLRMHMAVSGGKAGTS